jgi:peptidoglycan/xylan/chitin deacetylase (PgdA/CDA1 family)
MEAGGPWEGGVNPLLSLLFHDVHVREASESGFPGLSADRYKLSTLQFERQLAGLARVRHDAPVIVDGSVNHRSGAFAITFDDGGVSFYTQAAERLEARGWSAHCFITTGCIGRNGFLDRSQIRDLHRRGHAIGSHSVTHPSRFASLRASEIAREWSDSRNALADLLGAEVVAASVPGGDYVPRVAALASEAGFKVLFTSEPETRTSAVDGCMVAGRFTVRRGSPADFAARLGSEQPSTRLREWIAWNGKKAAKRLLGGAYPRLASVATARAR